MIQFDALQSYTPGTWDRNLNLNIYRYIEHMSEEFFRKGDTIRDAVADKEEFLKYQQNMKEVFLSSIGEIPYDNSLPLNAVTVGVVEEDELTIEKVVFNSRPGVYVTANFYLPKKRKDKCPGVLFQPGHAQNGKFCEDYQKVARLIARGGSAVLLIDPTGQGERSNYTEPGFSEPLISRAVMDHQTFGAQMFLTQGSPTKYFVADAMRAIDYLQSRPEIDSDKIGATGSSGGGTQTCVISLIDDRIKAAAPGTFVSTRRDIFHQGGAQDSEQIWQGITNNGFDHQELVACFCPKPYLILAVKSDFFPVEGARRVYNTNKKFYGFFDAEDSLGIVYDDSQHRYTEVLAKAASEFFAKHLGGEIVEVSTEALKVLPEKDLCCTKTGNVHLEFADSLSAFEENKAIYEKSKANPKTPEEKRAFFQEKVYQNRKVCPLDVVHLDTEITCGLYAEKIFWHPQDYTIDFGLLIRSMDQKGKKLPVTICLWEDGTNDIGRHKEEIQSLINKGRAVLVADIACIGENFPINISGEKHPKSVYGLLEKLNKDMVYMGDSILALMAYDLVKTVEMLKTEYGFEDIDVFTYGSYSVLGEIAKILLGINYTAISPMKLSDIITNKYYIYYNLAHLIMPEAGLYLE